MPRSMSRSVSRYGMTDFGANAKHIRKLFAEVTAALEKGEKTVLEQAEPKKDEAAAKPQAPRSGLRRPRIKNALEPIAPSVVDQLPRDEMLEMGEH